MSKHGSITPETMSAPQVIDLRRLGIDQRAAQYQSDRATAVAQLRSDFGKAAATKDLIEREVLPQNAVVVDALKKARLGATADMQQVFDEQIRVAEERSQKLIEAQREEIAKIDATLRMHDMSALVPIQGDLCVAHTYHTTVDDTNGGRVQSTGDPVVQRYSIDETATSALVGTYAGSGTLHPIETALFDMALQELSTRPSAERIAVGTGASAAAATAVPPSPNNVVLVDVFVRDANGAIKQDTTASAAAGKSVPETHTVALWKKKDGEIVLIDPSNAAFTEHLVRPLDAHARASTSTPPTTISSIPSKTQIYTPASATGPAPTQSRDCVDIAVKIGFVINETQQRGSATPDQILEHAMRTLTNQERVYRGATGKLLGTNTGLVQHPADRLKAALQDRDRQTSKRSHTTPPAAKPKTQGHGVGGP